ASVAGHANVIWLWDLAHGRPSTRAEHARRVVALAFAPDGDTLACADSLGNVTLWDLASRKERTLGGVTQAPSLPCRLPYSPAGRLLAARGVPSDWVSRTPPYWRGGVTLWEKWDSSIPRLLSCGDFVHALAFSPDSRFVIAASRDRHVWLWDLEQSEGNARLNHGRKTHLVAYAPNGHTIASASVDGLVKAWDAQSRRMKTTLKGQSKFLHAIAYSPDGRTLATASGDGRVRFWDVDSGRSLRAFDWGVGAVHSVAFAPDGMRAAAGGERDIII